MNLHSNLIFDLGMHRGLDTRFYLDKGFRVVALEANPEMVQLARGNLANYLETGALVIVEKALTNSKDEFISFFVNLVKDDWSSTKKEWAETGHHPIKEIRVPTVSLEALFSEYGVPYYVKCDIEGEDMAFVQQLCQLSNRPTYVSVEAIDAGLVDMLGDAGYGDFQIVNQNLNWQTKPPNPSREGIFAEVQFNGHMSGLFGKELPEDRWFSKERIRDTHTKFRELRRLDPNLALGWLDFHARLA